MKKLLLICILTGIMLIGSSCAKKPISVNYVGKSLDLKAMVDYAYMDGIDLKHGEGGNTAEGACGCVEIGLAQYFFDTDVCHKDCH